MPMVARSIRWWHNQLSANSISSIQDAETWRGSVCGSERSGRNIQIRTASVPVATLKMPVTTVGTSYLRKPQATRNNGTPLI